MTLREFKESDIYADAGCVEYININGEEIDLPEEELEDYEVVNYHMSSGGCLEIELRRVSENANETDLRI